MMKLLLLQYHSPGATSQGKLDSLKEDNEYLSLALNLATPEVAPAYHSSSLSFLMMMMMMTTTRMMMMMTSVKSFDDEAV